MRTGTMLVLAAGLPVCLSGVARATDTHIALNYNFNGMVQPAEIGLPDEPQGYRSIADRGMVVDGDPGGAGLPAAFGAAPIVGTTGISYSIITDPNVLDIVMMGNRNVNNPFELTAPGNNPDVGIAPAWLPPPYDQTGPQTTTLATPIVLDGSTQLGFLYNISNVGGTSLSYQIILGFSDAASLTVTVNGRDWFGSRGPLPPAANSGLSVQAQLGTYKSSDHADAGVTALPSTVLNVWEAVIDIHAVLLAGLGDYNGKHLTSITFQYPLPAPASHADFAVFAATVRSGVAAPANDNCVNAQVVTQGDTPGSSIGATGTTTSGCGTADMLDVWYRYTATSSGMIEARTCGAGFDTTLAVYTSCGGAAIACDDNGCGTASKVRWQATSGQSYLIRVAGNNMAWGTFNLHIDDPVLTFASLPLNYNFNGMVHGTTEQGTANVANLNGYRSVSDRGLLVTGAAGTINAAPIVDPDFMPFTIVTQPAQLDIVHLGDRNFVDNGNHAFGNGANSGQQPTWLPNPDQTTPQVTDLSTLNATLTPQSQIGVLYQVSNGGGRFDVTLRFTDNSSVTVTLVGPDWFQNAAPPPPLPGVATQRQLGVYTGTGNVDLAGADQPLNVAEGVFSVQSMIAAGLPNVAGKTLSAIVFENPIANNFGPLSTPANHAGFAIIAATLGGANVPNACYANCDGSTNPPVLNINDFICFQQRFAGGDPYANCDGSTNPPVLNINDFVCFQQRFVGGCP